MSVIIVIVKGNSNYYHILIYLLHNHVDMSMKSKYIICYLFMSIKYNLFLAALFIYFTKLTL